METNRGFTPVMSCYILSFHRKENSVNIHFYAGIYKHIYGREKIDSRYLHVVYYFHTKKNKYQSLYLLIRSQRWIFTTVGQNILFDVLRWTNFVHREKNMQTTMIQYQTGEEVQLILVCAWCPKSGYPMLEQGQEYSHGMCDDHLEVMMGGLHERKVRIH